MLPLFGAVLGLSLSLSPTPSSPGGPFGPHLDRENALRIELIRAPLSPVEDAALAALDDIAESFDGVPIVIADPFTNLVMIEVNGTF
jgi:hypothetical protein